MADHKDDFLGGDFDLNKDGVTDFFERELAWEILEKPMRDELAAQQHAEEDAALRLTEEEKEEEGEEEEEEEEEFEAAWRREKEENDYASFPDPDTDDAFADAGGAGADLFSDYSGGDSFDF